MPSAYKYRCSCCKQDVESQLPATPPGVNSNPAFAQCMNCKLPLFAYELVGPCQGEVGRKDDSEKLRYDLIPAKVEAALAAAITYGAKKYGARNWHQIQDDPEKGTIRDRYYGALRRHVNARRLGESLDPETGIPHLAHAMACLTFLLSLDLGKEEGLNEPT